MSTELSYRDTDRLIVFSYVTGAGGNFVINCLSLSRLTFPKVERHPTLPSRLLLKKITENDSLDFRLSYVLRSLPPKELDIKLKTWNAYEFNDVITYGYSGGNLARGEIDETFFEKNPNLKARLFFRELHKSGLYHFIIGHNYETFEALLKMFPNCRQVRFINAERWVRYCDKLGKLRRLVKNFEIAKMPGFNNSVDFDVESFYNQEQFLSEVNKLYEFFGFPDFNPQAISSFHKKYMNLHGIEV